MLWIFVRVWIYIYTHTHPFSPPFFNGLCFSLQIHILFDPLLWLTSLGVTRISAPVSSQLKKRFFMVDTNTLVVSKVVLFPLVSLGQPKEGSSVSPTCQHRGKTEAAVTALEGMLCISSKAFPGSSPCSLQGRLWLTDFSGHASTFIVCGSCMQVISPWRG